MITDNSETNNARFSLSKITEEKHALQSHSGHSKYGGLGSTSGVSGIRPKSTLSTEFAMVSEGVRENKSTTEQGTEIAAASGHIRETTGNDMSAISSHPYGGIDEQTVTTSHNGSRAKLNL